VSLFVVSVVAMWWQLEMGMWLVVMESVGTSSGEMVEMPSTDCVPQVAGTALIGPLVHGSQTAWEEVNKKIQSVGEVP
jgi:hypothetical protein